MPGIIERAMTSVGRAMRALETARHEPHKPAKRPLFLTWWADSGKWGGGDLGAMDAAQQRAKQNSWLFSALKMIAFEVSAAKIQVQVYKGEDQEPEKIANHPFLQVMRRPNPHMSKSFLWIYTSSWLNLDGNAFWFMAPDEDGNLAEIWPLPANFVEPYPGDRDRFIDHYELQVNGQIFEIPAEYICHFMYPNTHDVFRGESPLVAGILPVDADNAMARWNGAFFGRNNVMPSSIINLSSANQEAPIDESDLDRLREQLTLEYSAAERKTLITNAVGGVQAELLGWSARDMDFLAGRQFTKDEIYAIYGIPGGLLDKNATEANAQTADRVFKEKVIWPVLTLLAEQITVQVTNRFYGENIEAVFEDIRPSNRAMELQEATVAQGALTIDEYRARFFSLPPLPDGKGLVLIGTPPVAENPFGSMFAAPGDVPASLPEVLPQTEAASPTPSDILPSEPVPDLSIEQKAVAANDAASDEMPIETASQPGRHEGVCIMLYVPMPRATAMALSPEILPDGSAPVRPEDMHLTLAYLGDDASRMHARPEEVIQVIQSVFVHNQPIRARLSGVGRFFGDEGYGDNAFYASVDVPGLQDLRKTLVAELEEAGITVNRKHEFIPHITLAYLPKEAEAPYLDLSGMEVSFYFVTLAWGDKHYVHALTGKAQSSAIKEQVSENLSLERPDLDDLDEEDLVLEALFDQPNPSEPMKRLNITYHNELNRLKNRYQGEIDDAIAGRDARTLAAAMSRFKDEKARLRRSFTKRIEIITPVNRPAKSYTAAAKRQQDAFAAVAIRSDMKRWQTKSIKYLKDGKGANPPFESDLIPAEISALVRQGLEDADTAEQVKAVFGNIELGKQVYRDVDTSGLQAVVDEIKAARLLLERSFAGPNPAAPTDTPVNDDHPDN